MPAAPCRHMPLSAAMWLYARLLNSSALLLCHALGNETDPSAVLHVSPKVQHILCCAGSEGPQIATLKDLRCITEMGVIKGSSLRFPPLADLTMRFGSGPLASSADDAAAVAEKEANMAALADALKDREGAEQRHQTVQKVSRQRPHTHLDKCH